MRIKSQPDVWAQAVAADEALRDGTYKMPINGEPYLHASCVPLREVEFRNEHQLSLLDDECTGMCGVWPTRHRRRIIMRQEPLMPVDSSDMQALHKAIEAYVIAERDYQAAQDALYSARQAVIDLLRRLGIRGLTI